MNDLTFQFETSRRDGEGVTTAGQRVKGRGRPLVGAASPTVPPRTENLGVAVAARPVAAPTTPVRRPVRVVTWLGDVSTFASWRPAMRRARNLHVDVGGWVMYEHTRTHRVTVVGDRDEWHATHDQAVRDVEEGVGARAGSASTGRPLAVPDPHVASPATSRHERPSGLPRPPARDAGDGTANPSSP